MEAVKSLNRKKAIGTDQLPAEVLQSEKSIFFLHRLFCVCFETGKIPKEWEYGLINPILKDSNSDKREPLNYRGITITSSMYKAYCSILNKRLTSWVEANGIINDTQDGFRKNRSTMDHLSTLTSITENRKKMKNPRFVGFVDFKKAYDSIDKTLLWAKLDHVGVKGKMFSAIKSLYEQIKCCVRINGFHTEWFEVKTGLKQGGLLSPLLFNLYINDLESMLTQTGNGV